MAGFRDPESLITVRTVWIVLLSIALVACKQVSPIDLPAPESPTATVGLPLDETVLPTRTPTIPPSVTPTSTAMPTAIIPSQTPTSTSTVPSGPDAPTVMPDSSAYSWRLVLSGLVQPVDLTHAGDGSNRIFIIEQVGRIRIFQDGVLDPTPYLDISSKVGSQGFEQGLLGIAFHPRYEDNGYFYLNYTDHSGSTVLARYQVSRDDPDRADNGSELLLLYISQPYRNHNGGGLAFGPDGYLYAGLGDGGSAGDPLQNAQSLTTYLGKILRLDVDSREPYAIPSDNPFVNGGGLPEIWAYGLRNPWRFSFDRLTHDLYIADVGQNQWEEINFLPSGVQGGANFGWNAYEGSHVYQGAALENAIMPIAEYNHNLGCSVTGGMVYRGERLPDWRGVYLYGDYCSGRVWGLFQDNDGRWQNQLIYENVASISSFGEDEAGEIYLVDHQGSIYTLDAK